MSLIHESIEAKAYSIPNQCVLVIKDPEGIYTKKDALKVSEVLESLGKLAIVLRIGSGDITVEEIGTFTTNYLRNLGVRDDLIAEVLFQIMQKNKEKMDEESKS